MIEYYNYPQYVWARDIGALLTKHTSDEGTIVDAPSGDGVVSYWLMKRGFEPSRFELVDRSEPAISRARRLFAESLGVNTRVADLHDIEGREGRDVWLLINSFFLLHDIDDLVARLRPRFRFIVVVTPHIDRKNYELYSRKPGSVQNINAMPISAMRRFFGEHGYRVVDARDSGHIAYFRFTRPAVARFARRWLHLVDWLFRFRPGYYWLALLERFEGR